MKKLLSLLAVIGLMGCASNEVQQSPTYVETSGVYTSARTYNNCNTCSTSYTVKKPVEVIYKNVTYTTVYEPKTYEKTTYERKPYDCVKGELCK
jgi:hypothetical protein